MPFDPSELDDQPTLADTIRELSNVPSSETWIGRRRVQGLAHAERLTTQGTIAPLAELCWGTSRRLTRVGGSALAALIAYRLFVWLLPLSLVVVSVIALLDDQKVIDPQTATDRFGIAGYVAASVSTATANTGGPGFVSGVVLGGLFLLYATFALIRALRAVHALVWRVRLTPVPSPLRSTALTLGLLTAVVVTGGMIDGLRGSGGILFGVLLIGLQALLFPAAWLMVSLWLPHRPARWVDLLPGAIVFGVLVDVIHFLVVYVLYPYLEQKAATYGALGLAAGIMLALYGLGYVIAGTAALNAELADRREHRAETASQ
jgi:uncharacterized BrkB/YihY/UPF0761 family membrane protein